MSPLESIAYFLSLLALGALLGYVLWEMFIREENDAPIFLEKWFGPQATELDFEMWEQEVEK